MTPLSWEHWIDRYQGRGVRVLSNFILGQQGWEEVADYALDWARTHTGAAAVEH